MLQAFSKLQGTGNDFVVVETDPNPKIVPLLCDRRTGVGADGVLFVTDISKENASARMTVINRDGSRPEMCGNGVRCVSRYLVEIHEFPETHTVWSDAGARGCVYRDGKVDVQMGTVRVDSPIELSFSDRVFLLHPVNVGNPHAVAFVESHQHVAEFGAFLNEDRTAFPQGVNLEFAVRDGARFDVVVFERGVGLTDACGTGACAVAFAAWETGESEKGPLEIKLPGGSLTISPDGADACRMEGDVVSTFRGTLSDEIVEQLSKEDI